TAQDVTERKEAEEAQRQMAAIVDSCEEAIIGEALEGTILSWNPGAQQMYGYTASEALGEPATMLVPADRRDEVGDMLDRIARGERIEQVESVRVRRDGRAIDVALTVSPIRDGAGALSGASVIARDISEQKLRERYLSVQHEATRVLAEAATPEEALPALLEAIGEGMGWPVGAAWMRSREDGPELRCKAFWHRPGSSPEAFEAVTKRLRLAPGTGLPGSVWEGTKARWVPDVTVDPDSRRTEAAAADGLHACILLPVVAGADVLAVIEFLSYEVRPPDTALLELLDTLSAPIGQFLERKQADAQLAHQAGHDALTDLPNRRKLVEDLELALLGATEDQPQLLLLLDLDGFKAYNDTFGHAAGDALLARLGRRLATAMQGRGKSYRMGGDEFCVIGPLPADGAPALVDRARGALSERGEAFSITASCGYALLPTEGRTPTDALRLADRRMYARKDGDSRSSAARQSADVLLQVLAERSPELGSHVDKVTELCEVVARALDLPEDQMTHLLRAASLHDVGKAAIPQEILDKPGPLTEEEWSYVRRHTVIGDRILAAAPALVPAAKLVRSSHERLDGRGYPDGLAGDEIPLGARIIAACDAFDAMRSDRPYRSAMSTEGALSELQSCAGTQFDPAVVDALAAAVGGQRRDAQVTIR
ncbi:MAG: diguanylate cyclase, partial [Actinomycetota bacterium]|nr:diguanylate cyclase [Actinomycetota bacterium]